MNAKIPRQKIAAGPHYVGCENSKKEKEEKTEDAEKSPNGFSIFFFSICISGQ